MDSSTSDRCHPLIGNTRVTRRKFSLRILSPLDKITKTMQASPYPRTRQGAYYFSTARPLNIAFHMARETWSFVIEIEYVLAFCLTFLVYLILLHVIRKREARCRNHTVVRSNSSTLSDSSLSCLYSVIGTSARSLLQCDQG